MNNRMLASAVIVLLLIGAALWWLPDAPAKIVGADSRITVVGTLTPGDVAEIRRTVRREIWRGIFPRCSWPSIRALPAVIRYRASVTSLPIFGIIANADGTVEVETGAKVRGLPIEPWSHLRGDTTYRLKKGQKGWQIIRSTSYDWEEGCKG